MDLVIPVLPCNGTARLTLFHNSPSAAQGNTRNISSGNHRSALRRDDSAHVTKAIVSDIELGYGIPLNIEAVEKLKHAEVYPLGLQVQQTIDEKGRSIPKRRLTHDLCESSG